MDGELQELCVFYSIFVEIIFCLAIYGFIDCEIGAGTQDFMLAKQVH
jgi:hypothetical protein